MAEVVGLAASILQIAGAGVKLSTALYNFASSASRADRDVADIADDVMLTANALDSVGKVFEKEDGKTVVSRRAIQDANGLIKRCDAVFGEIQEVVEKRRKVCKDGKKILSTFGKFSWPLKEQRIELLRRRLESLKNSLMLLLHVLQLANGQAKGYINLFHGRTTTLTRTAENWRRALWSKSVKRSVSSTNDSNTRSKPSKPWKAN